MRVGDTRATFSNLEWYAASENNMVEFSKVWSDLVKGEAKDALQFLAEKHCVEHKYGILATFRDWWANDSFYARATTVARDKFKTKWVSPEELREMLKRTKYDKTGEVFYSEISWTVQMKTIQNKADLSNIDGRFFETEREVTTAIAGIDSGNSQERFDVPNGAYLYDSFRERQRARRKNEQS